MVYRIDERLLVMETDEDLLEFQQDLAQAYIQHGGRMDEKVEKWMDSEFNRVFVTWMYPDLSNMQ
jgi:hypothetical protein